MIENDNFLRYFNPGTGHFKHLNFVSSVGCSKCEEIRNYYKKDPGTSKAGGFDGILTDASSSSPNGYYLMRNAQTQGGFIPVGVTQVNSTQDYRTDEYSTDSGTTWLPLTAKVTLADLDGDGDQDMLVFQCITTGRNTARAGILRRTFGYDLITMYNNTGSGSPLYNKNVNLPNTYGLITWEKVDAATAKKYYPGTDPTATQPSGANWTDVISDAKSPDGVCDLDFGDLDNDGDLDAMINGVVWQNTGSKGSPKWTLPSMGKEKTPWGNVKLGSQSGSSIIKFTRMADINDDGYADVYTTEDKTALWWMPNKGNGWKDPESGAPYTWNDMFNNAPHDENYDWTNGGGKDMVQKFNFTRYKGSDWNANVAWGQLDGSNGLDAFFLGGETTSLLELHLSRGASSIEKAASTEQMPQALLEYPFKSTSVSMQNVPTAADIDNDGDLDLIMSTEHGTLVEVVNLAAQSFCSFSGKLDASSRKCICKPGSSGAQCQSKECGATQVDNGLGAACH
jgi:hypothetical protein